MLKNWRLWIGLLISLVFLYWVISQVKDVGQVVESLKRAQYGYVVPALAVYFLGVWIRAIRWRYLL
ncbi:MAG: lysylphosphatidylglycerol synthase domain-containing protein, partial [Chloroflexota bacterium]